MQLNKGNLYTDKQYIELLKIKIEQLEEDLEAEKSISSNLAQRILKAKEKSEHYSHICLSNRKYKEFDIFNEISKTLKGE